MSIDVNHEPLRVLVLAYRFPPFNVVASLRPLSWAVNFPKFGIKPTIVSRYWSGDETPTTAEVPTALRQPVLEKGPYDVLRMPYRAQSFRTFKKLSRFRIFGGLYILFHSMFGRGAVDNNANEFLPFLREFLAENPTDLILVTAGPMSQISVAYQLSKEFNVPIALDFRDHWNNQILNPSASRTPLRRITDWFLTIYTRRWAKRAIQLSAVTSGMLQRIRDDLRSSLPTVVVANGFEKDLFANVNRTERNAVFTFSVVGTLYADQELDFFFRGLKLFLSGKQKNEVLIQFVGAGVFAEVREKILADLPYDFVEVTARIPRSQAIAVMRNSDVLAHIGWPGYKGIASAKIYEYLASGNNILIAPNDHDEMEKLIISTGAGKLAETPEEMAEILNGWFEEWSKTGRTTYRGNWDEVEKYTRENQAAIMAQALKNAYRSWIRTA